MARIKQNYQTAADVSESSRTARSQLRRFLIGAMIGAAPPLLLGGYGLVRFWIYLASLPPDAAGCGTPAVAPLFLIVVVAPFLGSIGGVIARLFP